MNDPLISCKLPLHDSPTGQQRPTKTFDPAGDNIQAVTTFMRFMPELGNIGGC